MSQSFQVCARFSLVGYLPFYASFKPSCSNINLNALFKIPSGQSMFVSTCFGVGLFCKITLKDNYSIEAVAQAKILTSLQRISRNLK